MPLQKFSGHEICSAGMPGAGHKTHVRRHVAVGSFALHGPFRTVRTPFPFLHAASRGIDVPAEAALVRFLSSFEAVEVVGEEGFSELDVDGSARVLHHFFGPHMPGIHGRRFVIGIETIGFFFDQLGIASEVRADVIAVFASPQWRILQAEFEIGDFTGFAVADEPVVGVSPVIPSLMMRT